MWYGEMVILAALESKLINKVTLSQIKHRMAQLLIDIIA